VICFAETSEIIKKKFEKSQEPAAPTWGLVAERLKGIEDALRKGRAVGSVYIPVEKKEAEEPAVVEPPGLVWASQAQAKPTRKVYLP